MCVYGRGEGRKVYVCMGECGEGRESVWRKEGESKVHLKSKAQNENCLPIQGRNMATLI